MHKIGPLSPKGGRQDHRDHIWRNSTHPQTVGDIDPIFLAGTARVQYHLVLKYNVWECPLRGKTGDQFWKNCLTPQVGLLLGHRNF